MSGPFGLLASGFVAKRQTDIIDDINTRMVQQFGQQIDLSSTSVLGNLAGIFSEPAALIWEALDAIYASQFAATASTDAAVDNILALANMSKKPATPTVTAPNGVTADDGTVENGFVLYGSVNALVPAGTLFQSTTQPALTFSLDSDATIAHATNAEQSVVFSQTPTTGAFALSVPTGTGETLVTSPIGAPFQASDVMSALAALQNAAGKYPYADVLCEYDGVTMTLFFGLGLGIENQPSSGGRSQPVVAVVNSTLAAGSSNAQVVVNTLVTAVAYGAPAQATGSATCTTTGPNPVLAGQLSVILTPVSGLSSVTNQLDCITGSNVESNADALLRRSDTLNGGGTAKLDAIKAAVAAVPGVLRVLAFQNLSNTALQNITFPTPAPTSGTYMLRLANGVTGPIAANAPAKAVQNAINAVRGYNVIVTGSPIYGLQVDFNGSLGGAAQPLIQVLSANSTLKNNIAVTFGRPPNAFEIVAFGGNDLDIQRAIQASQPAGIGSYGSPVVVTNGSVSAGSNALTLTNAASVTAGLYVAGPAILDGTSVQSVAGNVVTLTQPAPIDGAGVYKFTHAAALPDADGVAHVVSFTRAMVSLPYVALRLLTDYYNVPGDPTSGRNTYATFQPASVGDIADDLISIGNAVKPGGVIVTKGYAGLVGAFNNVPGVLDYAMALQLGSRPAMPSIHDAMPDNIQLLPGNVASFELLNIDISWS